MRTGPTTATVITLATTPDRLAAFTAGWEAAGAPLPLTVHSSAPNDDPIVGCYDAHLAVLEAASGPLLVLEDDATFAPGFSLDVAWPVGANLFYLGGEHRLPPRPYAPGIVRGTFVRRTHAYVVWNPRRLAQQLRRPHRGHVDTVMNHLPLGKFALAPFTVGQHGVYWN